MLSVSVMNDSNQYVIDVTIEFILLYWFVRRQLNIECPDRQFDCEQGLMS
jgi:hypothetical protein